MKEECLKNGVSPEDIREIVKEHKARSQLLATEAHRLQQEEAEAARIQKEEEAYKKNNSNKDKDNNNDNNNNNNDNNYKGK